MQRSLAPFVVMTVLVAGVTAQSTLVLPNGLANAEGSISNAFPWGRLGAGLRISNLYDSTNFTAQGIAAPILVTRLRWRVDAGSARVWGATNYPNATISLSTCPIDQGAVTAGMPMANVEGADKVTCYSGPVAIAAGATTAPGPAPGWHVDVPLTTPFVYDPSHGDLNIETELPIQAVTGNALQLDVDGNNPHSSRLFVSTGYPNGATSATLNHGLVVELTYVPAAGLYAGFSATPTSGPSPLQVHFTDGSYSGAPGGVTGWAWDFDGDHVVDSTLRNPTHVFTGCADHDVTLTVTDGAHMPATLTKPAFVHSDPLTVGFFWTEVSPPNYLMFLDASVPPATSFAWDLDGDGITDSTSPTPVAWMSLCATTRVRLTASRACRTGTATRPVFLSSGYLNTTYTAGTGGSPGSMVMFDVLVSYPTGVDLCGLHHHLGDPLGTPFSADVYITAGSYVGHDGDPSVWRLVANCSGVGEGPGAASGTPFPTPLYLAPGSYGFAIHYPNASPRYSVGNGSNQVYSTNELTITTGAVRSALFAGSYFTPRVWNGTVHLDSTYAVTTAGYGFFGPGCAGSLGISRLAAADRPRLGRTLQVTIDRLPQSVAFLMTGFSNTASPFGPLPVDLTVYGAPGCSGRVSPDAIQLLLGAGQTATWSLAVPNDPALAGLRMFQQAFVFDPGANALGAVLSDAGAMMFGW